MSLILAIDPGTTHSGVVSMNGDGVVTRAKITPNHEVVSWLNMGVWAETDTRLAIEMIASYGMAVGAEVFATCRWVGRFQQAWHAPDDVRLVPRMAVKMHLCKTSKAKDANIRQAIIDLYGGKAEAIGTVKKQGPLYGVKSHAWAALGVAITAAHT